MSVQSVGISSMLYDVVLREDSLAIAVGDNGVIIRSTDAGITWAQKYSGTTEPLWDVGFLDPQRGIITGNSGTILYTSDRGETWSPESSGVTVILDAISIPDPHHVWIAGEDGTILHRNMFARISLPGVPLNFGPIYMDSSRVDSIVVTNDGTDSLFFSCSADNPDFLPLDTLGALAVGDTAWIRVGFRPTRAGYRSGHLLFDHNAMTSPDTVLLIGNGLEWDSTIVGIRAGWNLVSLPRSVSPDSVPALFPSAISEAFRYAPDTGYVAVDRLVPGRAYWLKFPAVDTVTLAGITTTAETVNVRKGWNLLGPVSSPVPADSIVQSPPGVVISDYFGYDGTYFHTQPQTLLPGRGYWVKVSADGTLYLYGH